MGVGGGVGWGVVLGRGRCRGGEAGREERRGEEGRGGEGRRW